jgi:putative inorganic carbon (HCO3(-)) transporter
LSGFRVVWQSKHSAWQYFAVVCAATALAVGIALLPLPWAALVILGGIGAVLALFHPQILVLLIVVAIPFGSLRQVTLGPMRVGATDLLVALLLATWLMRKIARRDSRLFLPTLVLPLLIFILVLVTSLVVTTSLEDSAKEIAKWLEFLVLYLFVANEGDARWTKVFVATLLGTGALVALHGIYQFLFQVGPEGFVLFGRYMRAYGTFEQPNPYAGYLGLTLPLAAGLLGTLLLQKPHQVALRWLLWAGVCGALMLLALVMSWSRGGWLGFAAAALVIALAIAVRSGRTALLSVMVVVLLGYVAFAGGLSLVPSSLLQRFGDFIPYLGSMDVRGLEITDANFAVVERMAHWQAALGMWTDHLWLGVGIGNYEVAYASYALPLWPLSLGHAHNYYLNIAAETGLLGLLAYLYLWGTALFIAWRASRQASGWQLGIALGVLGMLVHLAVHNLFDNLFVHAMYLQVAILLAIASSIVHRSSAQPAAGAVGGRPSIGGMY